METQNTKTNKNNYVFYGIMAVGITLILVLTGVIVSATNNDLPAQMPTENLTNANGNGTPPPTQEDTQAVAQPSGASNNLPPQMPEANMTDANNTTPTQTYVQGVFQPAGTNNSLPPQMPAANITNANNTTLPPPTQTYVQGIIQSSEQEDSDISINALQTNQEYIVYVMADNLEARYNITAVKLVEFQPAYDFPCQGDISTQGTNLTTSKAITPVALDNKTDNKLGEVATYTFEMIQSPWWYICVQVTFSETDSGKQHDLYRIFYLDSADIGDYDWPYLESHSFHPNGVNGDPTLQLQIGVVSSLSANQIAVVRYYIVEYYGASAFCRAHPSSYNQPSRNSGSGPYVYETSSSKLNNGHVLTTFAIPYTTTADSTLCLMVVQADGSYHYLSMPLPAATTVAVQ